MPTGVRPSVRLSVSPVGLLTVIHQGAACDAASVHFGRQKGLTYLLATALVVQVKYSAVCMCVLVYLDNNV